MKLLDGKKIAQDIREQLKKDIKDSGITPGLAAVLVGKDPSSHIYVGLKERAAKEVGIHFERIELPKTATQADVEEAVGLLNNNNAIHGILVQLPLPAHLDTNAIIATMDPKKDADGFHEDNNAVVSPPHAGILRFLEETGEPLEGKKVALLANSEKFAQPLEQLLTMNGMEVATLIKQKNYQSYTQKADIVVIAIGKPSQLKGEDIKEGAILIDVGTTKIEGKKVVIGDVDYSSVKEKAGFLTPVPGGVGPMTVALLLKNTFELAQK